MTILTDTTTHVLEEARRRVDKLDLSKIHLNLMDAEDGPGWTAERCQETEERYRMFLTGRLLFPDLTFAPDKDVDTFWHYHILDTRAYMADCNELFGEYLHHDPYLGMEGEESERQLKAAWESTQELYQLIGVSPGSTAAFCGMGSPAFCGMSPAAFCGMARAAFCGM